jgi:hypothetical protein
MHARTDCTHTRTHCGLVLVQVEAGDGLAVVAVEGQGAARVRPLPCAVLDKVNRERGIGEDRARSTGWAHSGTGLCHCTHQHETHPERCVHALLVAWSGRTVRVRGRVMSGMQVEERERERERRERERERERERSGGIPSPTALSASATNRTGKMKAGWGATVRWHDWCSRTPSRTRCSVLALRTPRGLFGPQTRLRLGRGGGGSKGCARTVERVGGRPPRCARQGG